MSGLVNRIQTLETDDGLRIIVMVWVAAAVVLEVRIKVDLRRRHMKPSTPRIVDGDFDCGNLRQVCT